jgi:hypothetical protein
MYHPDPIKDYLQHCREITAFCTQNGWIDNDSVKYEVLGSDENAAIISVEFLEILMEGSGCVADKVSCHGRLRLIFDNEGCVQSSVAI